MRSSLLLLTCIIILSEYPTSGYINSRKAEATTDLDNIAADNRVLIKWNSGGYLKDDGDSTVSLDPNFSSEYFVWSIHDNQNGYGKMFKNRGTGKFLKAASTTTVATGDITGSGGWASWNADGIGWGIDGHNFDYRRKYLLIENYSFTKCMTAGNDHETSITLVNCDTSGSPSLWMLEVLENTGTSQATYPQIHISWIILGLLFAFNIINLIIIIVNYRAFNRNKRKTKWIYS